MGATVLMVATAAVVVVRTEVIAAQVVVEVLEVLVATVVTVVMVGAYKFNLLTRIKVKNRLTLLKLETSLNIHRKRVMLERLVLVVAVAREDLEEVVMGHLAWVGNLEGPEVLKVVREVLERMVVLVHSFQLKLAFRKISPRTIVFR